MNTALKPALMQAKGCVCGDPAERTARASERLLELNEASALGIKVLVETAQKDSKWVVRTAILTMLITGLTLAALIVAIFTLRAA